MLRANTHRCLSPFPFPFRYLPRTHARTITDSSKQTNKAGSCPSGSLLETFRFQDEDDCGYEIFSIPSRVRAQTSVILAGKRDNVVIILRGLVGMSQQRKQVSKCRSFIITVPTFPLKKSLKNLSRVSSIYFWECRRSHLCPKGPYYIAFSPQKLCCCC